MPTFARSGGVAVRWLVVVSFLLASLASAFVSPVMTTRSVSTLLTMADQARPPAPWSPLGMSDSSIDMDEHQHHHQQQQQQRPSPHDMNAILQQGILFAFIVVLLTQWAISGLELDAMRGWTATEMAQGIAMRQWHQYSYILAEYPVQTKALTSATVYTIGDVLAQQTAGATWAELDRMRTLRSMLAGLIGHGPMSHVWYNVSEHLFDNVLHWTAWWSVIPKVVLDQAFWSPIWNNSYIILLGLMKRDSVSTIWSDVQRTTIPLVLSGLKLWPMAHVVTYGLIPVENRLLWVDTVEILWVTILATQAAGGAGEGETSEDDAIIDIATATTTPIPTTKA